MLYSQPNCKSSIWCSSAPSGTGTLSRTRESWIESPEINNPSPNDKHETLLILLRINLNRGSAREKKRLSAPGADLWRWFRCRASWGLTRWCLVEGRSVSCRGLTQWWYIAFVVTGKELGPGMMTNWVARMHWHVQRKLARYMKIRWLQEFGPLQEDYPYIERVSVWKPNGMSMGPKGGTL